MVRPPAGKKKGPLKSLASDDNDLPPDTLISHDYGNWPLNRGWHLNRGSAVMANASRQVSSFLCVRLSTEAGKTIFFSLSICGLGREPPCIILGKCTYQHGRIFVIHLLHL